MSRTYDVPGDETAHMLANLKRQGAKPETTPVVMASVSPVERLVAEAAAVAVAEDVATEAASVVETPVEVQVLSETQDGNDRLNMFARMLQRYSSATPIVAEFETDVGTVRCPLLSFDVSSSGTGSVMSMGVIREDMPFWPKLYTMMEFTVNKDGRATKYHAECLACPLPLPQGFPFDLLLWATYPAHMLKEGRTRDGAPSTVSGLPSDGVDESGEPVVTGEKSAAVTTPLDFDVPRKGEDQ